MSKTIKIGKRIFTVLFPDLLRPLTESERRGLKKSIRAKGVEVPVVVDADLGVIDGINRLEIAAEVGLVNVPILTKALVTEGEKRDLAIALNTNRRHLTREEQEELRRQRVERVAKGRREAKSLRTLAADEGVSESQVRRDLEKAGAPGGAPDPVDDATVADQPDLWEPEAQPATLPSPPPTTLAPTPSPSPELAGKVRGRDGKSYPARAAEPKADSTYIDLDRLKKAWHSATAEARQQFLSWIQETE